MTGGNVARLAGGQQEAETLLREAEKLLREHPTVPFYRARAAAAKVCLAALRLANRSPEEARGLLKNALAVFVKLASDFPDIPKHRLVCAETQAAYAMACLMAGSSSAEGEEQLRAADAALEKLADAYPRVARFRQLQSSARLQRVQMRMARGERKQAARDMDAAQQVMARLARDFPSCPQFRRHLADAQASLAGLLAALEDHAGAEAKYRAAVDGWKRLAADFPSVVEYRLSSGNSFISMGQYFARSERMREAEEAYGEALRIHRRLCDDAPNNALAVLSLGAAYSNRAFLRQGQQRHSEALEDYTHAVACAETSLRLAPQRRDWLENLKGTLTHAVTPCWRWNVGRSTTATCAGRPK